MERQHDLARSSDQPKDDKHSDRLFYWLRFVHSGLSRAQQDQLLSVYSTPQNLFETARTDWPKAAQSALARGPDLLAMDRDLKWAQQTRCNLVFLDHAYYPTLLRETQAPPWLLYVKGDTAVLSNEFIAIVGSRNPTTAGSDTAARFATAFAELGWGIASGMATGIDGAAHRGALQRGKTVAILGTGPDRVYPFRHTKLAEDIVENGALVTEFPPGTPARRQHFPQRNRIISGISRAVLVIEAGLRSGSLITARFAADQGREVCAVPGSIRTPAVRGCHRLIKQGAKLVECIDDVLEELGVAVRTDAIHASGLIDHPSFAEISRHMGADPVTTTELIQRSGLTTGSICSMLLRMEVMGLVELLPGGLYQRIK